MCYKSERAKNLSRRYELRGIRGVNDELKQRGDRCRVVERKGFDGESVFLCDGKQTMSIKTIINFLVYGEWVSEVGFGGA